MVAAHLSRVYIRPSQPRWHSYDRATCPPPMRGGGRLCWCIPSACRSRGMPRQIGRQDVRAVRRTGNARPASTSRPPSPDILRTIRIRDGSAPTPSPCGERPSSAVPQRLPVAPAESSSWRLERQHAHHSGSPRLCLPSARAIRRMRWPSIDPSGSHPGRPSDGRSGGQTACPHPRSLSPARGHPAGEDLRHVDEVTSDIAALGSGTVRKRIVSVTASCILERRVVDR